MGNGYWNKILRLSLPIFLMANENLSSIDDIQYLTNKLSYDGMESLDLISNNQNDKLIKALVSKFNWISVLSLK